MKRYIKNLLIALRGRNPYQEELDGLKEKYEKAGENVRILQNMYYDAAEKAWDAEKRESALQQLTENLRKRIRELRGFTDK